MTCPDHRPVPCEGGRICLSCQVFTPTPGTKVGPSYRTPEKGAVGAKRAQPEAALVSEIVIALRKIGRTVLRVGQWRADMAGSTAGTPDLFVWCPNTLSSAAGPAGWWTGLEIKTPAGRLSPAQKALADAGQVVVVRSITEAFEAIGEWRR